MDVLERIEGLCWLLVLGVLHVFDMAVMIICAILAIAFYPVVRIYERIFD